MALTETKLLEQTASILGVSLAQLVKAGTLVYAKREFLNHQKYSAAEGGDSESALLRSGSGVAGVADARILAAYQVLADTKVPITPAKLATRAVTGYPTALRWLKIHHPELLISKPDEASVAPALELLSSDPYLQKGMGLMALTGRRPAEIFFSRLLQPPSGKAPQT